MASLSADGKKILNNYDRITGVPFNASIVTKWEDGTVMTDAKVDNAVYFKNKPEFGGGYSRRDFEGPVDARWFGVKGDGVTDDILAINKMLDVFGRKDNEFQNAGNKIFNFPAGRTYLISDTIRFWGRQTLNFNFSKIKYTGSGTIIGKKLITDTLFTAYKSTINQPLIETNTASIGVDFFGCDECHLNEATINFGTKADNIIGVRLKHGTGSEQCYANVIYNTNVQIFGVKATSSTQTYGIHISGTPGVSGANINRIEGGSYGGRVRYPIYIDGANNNVGNVFVGVDIEGWDSKTDNFAAVTCNAPLNVFEDLHIENYTNTFVFNSSGNVVRGLSTALTDGIVDNSGGNHVFGQANSGTIALSLGNASDVIASAGTKLRIASDVQTAFRMDTVASAVYPGSRNFAWKVESRGEFDFSLRRSLLKDGDPSDTATSEVLFAVDNTKKTKLYQLIITDLLTKDRDSQFFATKGGIYRTSLGEVRAIDTQFITHREYDGTTTPYTPATINTAYPNSRKGTAIICESLGYQYIKTSDTQAGGGWFIQKIATLGNGGTGSELSATTTLRGLVLRSAALTATAPTSVTQTSTAATATYTQADIQKMVTDITNLTTQLNASIARQADLITKLQAAGILT